MQLKDLDKYIKEKVREYKPDHREEVWKNIESRLPASKVPQIRGSWMLPVAALVVILSIVPFLLRFNNAEEERFQASVLNKINQGTTDQPASGDKIATRGNSPVMHQHQLNSLANSNPVHRGHSVRQYDTNPLLNGKDVIETEKPVINNDPALKEENNNYMSALGISGQEIEINFDNIPDQKYHHKSSDNNLASNSKFLNSGWNHWQSIFYPFWKNPGYTGAESKWCVSADEKLDMVPEVKSTNYKTNVGIEHRVQGIGLGVGFYYNAEQTHFSTQTTYGLAVSKILLQKGTSTLRIGASASMINNTLFYSSLNYPDQYVPIWGAIKTTSEKDPSETTTYFGLNGGLWFNNKHIIAGADVSNINQPRPHHLEEAAPLPRMYRATVGYRFTTGSFQWLPMVEIRRQNTTNQLSTTLTAVYNNTIMATVDYQDISPNTGKGNLLAYIGYNYKNNCTLFAGCGYNTEWQDFGVNEYFVHGGLKLHLP
jgi:hypothetical protein